MVGAHLALKVGGTPKGLKRKANVSQAFFQGRFVGFSECKSHPLLEEMSLILIRWTFLFQAHGMHQSLAIYGSTHTIHGTGMFTIVYLLTYHKKQPNVGRYTIHGWYGVYDGT